MTQPPYKILLVEDNPGDVLLIEESLRSQDIRYEITHCETVEAAVQIVSGYGLDDPNVPDLLLLDYNLPGGDARNVIQAVLANPALAGTRKAVITSSLSPRDRENALEAGAESFISKPSELDSFLSEVGNAIVRLLSAARSRANPDGTSFGVRTNFNLC
jgi:chemotaxis family two-component system response regulator Rcp1